MRKQCLKKKDSNRTDRTETLQEVWGVSTEAHTERNRTGYPVRAAACKLTNTTSGPHDPRAASNPLQCVIIHIGSVFHPLCCSACSDSDSLIFKHADFSRSLCICIYKADSLTEVSIRTTACMQGVGGGGGLRGQRWTAVSPPIRLTSAAEERHHQGLMEVCCRKNVLFQQKQY